MKSLRTTLFMSFVLFLSLTAKAQKDDEVVLGELEIVGETNKMQAWPIGSVARLTDVIHMRLALSFDIAHRQAHGNAELYCTPYFRNIDTVILNAQAFDVERVAILNNAVWVDLEYLYDSNFLKIILDKTKTRKDTFQLKIEYVANPEKVTAVGGEAITDAKGLYFINHENQSHLPMQQFWTQGEVQSNSAWFPTVDEPNEKITHEIALTVDTSWVTLSNGHIDFITDNEDGTRTDYWLMNQPHAPYLVMIAAGEFSIVRDKWGDVPVNYFVEREWKSSAQRIFGNTPEMLTFYSEILATPYPWEKYDQIVVREYVSGAMENTTATVHGDFLYTDEKAFADETHEDVIAHELFHQWFGDLVTCESWGQLPLNESFATYGEYLWIEHKYGIEEADWHLLLDLEKYLNEFAYGHRPHMIRYDVTNPIEMFDSHSYAKGGRILHMLRNYLGDDMFFGGLQVYLADNAFGTAEIHTLRMAFEKASGQDLNWFFDQWFLASGHPVLDISYAYDKEKGEQTVTVKQTQDLIEYPLYILPVKIAVHTKKETEIHNVIINKEEQTFVFKVENMQGGWVSFDADKMLLCEKEDHLSDAFLLSQLAQSELMLDKLAAVKVLANSKNKNLRATIAGVAMKDKSAYVRNAGLEMLLELDEAGLKKVKKNVLRIAEKDTVNFVRAEAISALSEIYDINEKKIYESGWEANSYETNGEALIALCKHNPDIGLPLTREFVRTDNRNLDFYIWEALSEYGTNSDLMVLHKSIDRLPDGYLKTYAYFYLGEYAINHDDVAQAYAIDLLFSVIEENENPQVQQRCKNILQYIVTTWRTMAEESESNSEKKELLSKADELEGRF